jgi:hypothetical protein
MAHANAKEFIILSEPHEESGKCQKAEKKKKNWKEILKFLLCLGTFLFPPLAITLFLRLENSG